MYKNSSLITKIKENENIFVYAAVKVSFLNSISTVEENVAITAIVDEINLKKGSKREKSKIQSSIKKYWNENKKHLKSRISRLENILKSISKKPCITDTFKVGLKQVQKYESNSFLKESTIKNLGNYVKNNEKQFIKAAVDVDFLSFVRKGEFVEGAKLLLYTGMKIKEAEDCIPYLVSNISQNWHVSSSDLKQKVEDEIFKRKNGESNKNSKGNTPATVEIDLCKDSNSTNKDCTKANKMKMVTVNLKRKKDESSLPVQPLAPLYPLQVQIIEDDHKFSDELMESPIRANKHLENVRKVKPKEDFSWILNKEKISEIVDLQKWEVKEDYIRRLADC